jgi:hypothetical protein
MFRDGAFTDTTREDKADIAVKFWNMIADFHPKEWADIEKLGVKGQGRKAFEYKLLELTGLIAWSQVADSRVLAPYYNSNTGTVDWDAVQRSIEILSERIDWRKEGEYKALTGEVGGPKICKDMEKVLSQH